MYNISILDELFNVWHAFYIGQQRGKCGTSEGGYRRRSEGRGRGAEEDTLLAVLLQFL